MPPPASIDTYIDGFPPEVQEVLQRIRRAAFGAAPDTTEGISYGIPTLMLGGRQILFFAAWKRHVSVYPVPGDPALQHDVAPYLSGKGTLRFPLDRPIPYALIGRIAAAARKDRA
jgi:uncharacterized protein YdhG (YjbR/CyaY superfamily)